MLQLFTERQRSPRVRRPGLATITAVVLVLALFSAAWSAEPADAAGASPASGSQPAMRTLASGLNTPGSIVQGPRGNRYVAVHGAILMLTPDGNTVEIARGLPSPLVLSHAPDNSLYAASPTTGAVYRFAPNGAWSVVARNLDMPAGIAVDRDGNCTISLAGSGEVVTLMRCDREE
ncbi:hypothetical protein [Oceanidesulfovibrio marinus]|uniref:Uncharacterized protein n=1 Tax=Oceanidesulfovibrio marinus TaxID=370038 RepID=A0A6P1ZEM6_9BACT|nr:hypothetical protein [Oceanidesulfovibrio marinus]TVM33094.1 hypothetical protein DQK91_13110 [Oceanidesulfovibrio marinus]